MSSTVATRANRTGRLGVMVRTHHEIHVYWQPSQPAGGALLLRVTDLTGRAVSESLDATGYRELPVAESTYVANLLPGHLYLAEVGEHGPKGFTPLLSVGPVQTPWQEADQPLSFPSLYHRS